MKKAAGLAAFALIAGSLLTCAVDLTPPGRRYALVYGVTTYTTDPAATNYPNLAYPAEDAISVKQMLDAEGYDEVLLKYRDPDHVDSPPTKANLISDLEYFASIIDPNDTFIFYFSGHGTSSGGKKYFIPYLGVAGVSPFTFNPGLSVKPGELAGYLDAIPTARKIVILDSCYSGGFVSNPLEVDLTPPGYIRITRGITPDIIAQAIKNYAEFSTSGGSGISPYGNAIVISASGSNEYSFEDDSPFEHGIATYFLLQSRQSGDLNGDGLVTALEAFSLIKAGMDEIWNPSVNVSPGIDPDDPDPEYHETYAPHVSGGPLDYGIF
jgi:hypothetical protein